MTYTDFTDRTTYLAARAAWRADYADLSQSIREIKKAMSAKQKKDGSGTAYREQMSREAMRVQARRMMKQRTAMTERSAELRAERLAEKEAA
jgi:hypothetical protein